MKKIFFMPTQVFDLITTLAAIPLIVAAITILLTLLIAGVGYLLTFILPFSFFQASELSAIMAVFGVLAVYAVNRTTAEKAKKEACTCGLCEDDEEDGWSGEFDKKIKALKQREANIKNNSRRKK